MTDDIKVKMEANELQNYLETFNKEIEGNDSNVKVLKSFSDEEGEDEEDEDEGTYFVDQAGNYYYQANKDSEPVLTDPPEGMEHEYVEEDEEEVATGTIVEKQEPEETIAPFIEEEDETSENPTGAEVSYVFIMDDDNKIDEVENEDNASQASGEQIYEFEGGDGAETITSDTKVIKVHNRRQTTAQVHMCNYCSYTSSKRYLLSRHMKSHSEERPYKCSVCERGFKTYASLQNHVNTHTGTKPHACKFCTSCFTTSGELVRHVRYRHTHEKPHKCTECDYASVELSKLKRHIRCHTGERPYQCPHCTYASPDTFKLKRHLRIHTGEKPYECDVCHARFTQSNSLKAHKLIHSVGDKPVFNCELCPTTCGRKTDLRIHVQKLHTSDKPLRCKRCGNIFADRYSYKLHAKTHEGEKCYMCELCPYASISARHLESHMLIHTDQKPFKCEMCDQSFRQKQLLKRHVNLYHNPNYVAPVPKEKVHKCPTCHRSFRHKGNLIRHMAQHDPESNVREQSMALKIGRQKRIQIIDGQQVEIMTNEDDDEEEEEEEDEDQDPTEEDECFIQHANIKEDPGEVLVNVDHENGQEYVVLEVIQIQEDGQKTIEDVQAIEEHDPMAVDDDFMLSEHLDDEVLHSLNPVKRRRVEPHKMLSDDKDMSNCFGFDDDEDENKSGIKLLDYEDN